MAETNDDAPNFDISGLLRGAMNMMQGVKGMADNSRKTVVGFFEAASALNRSAKAMEQLVGRMTKLVDDFEAPVRALLPEYERAAERVRRVSDMLEGPVDNLVSGLERAVGNFDRMAVSALPESMDAMGRQLSSFLELFGELPRMLAPFFPGRRLGSFGSSSSAPRPFVEARPATSTEAAVHQRREEAPSAYPTSVAASGISPTPNKEAARRATGSTPAKRAGTSTTKNAATSTPTKGVAGTSTTKKAVKATGSKAAANAPTKLSGATKTGGAGSRAKR